jgi:hypothetical protein
MQVVFPKDFKRSLQTQGQLQHLSALDHVSITFQSEWPLEIILDEETILGKYNSILSFLMKIKRVNYVLTQRDFWHTHRITRTMKPKKPAH